MEKIPAIHLSSSALTKKTQTTQPKRDISGYHYGHEEPYNPVRGEMSVWRAVITQALMDAGSNSHKSEARTHKRMALAWLLEESEDFTTVCEYAGLEPCYVRRMIK